MASVARAAAFSWLKAHSNGYEMNGISSGSENAVGIAAVRRLGDLVCATSRPALREAVVEP